MRLNAILISSFLAILGALLACAPWPSSSSSRAADPQAIFAVTPTPTINDSYYSAPDQVTATPSPTPERLPFNPDSTYIANRPYRARFGDIIPGLANTGSEDWSDYTASIPPFYSIQEMILIEHPQGDIVYNINTGQTWPAEQRPPDSREDGEVFVPAGMTLAMIMTEIYDLDKNLFGCNIGVNFYFKAGDYPNVPFNYSIPYSEPEGQTCSARAWTLGLYPAVGIRREDVLISTETAIVYP